MEFLVPKYSCLQNPWLAGYRPQIPVLSSVLNWICWNPPSHEKKFLGTPLVADVTKFGTHNELWDSHSGVAGSVNVDVTLGEWSATFRYIVFLSPWRFSRAKRLTAWPWRRRNYSPNPVGLLGTSRRSKGRRCSSCQNADWFAIPKVQHWLNTGHNDT